MSSHLLPIQCGLCSDLPAVRIDAELMLRVAAGDEVAHQAVQRAVKVAGRNLGETQEKERE